MIRFILLALNLLFVSTALAAPPARTQTYTPGEVISSSEVTENEDNIFNYLQSGVDTYADGTIVNADLNNSANIQSDKLNLTSIGQAVLINSLGSLEVDGTTQLDGAVTVNGSAAFGAITTGVVSGIDINGGTIDGVAIGGTTAPLVHNIDINGGSIDGTTIGASTPSSIVSTTLQANSTFKLGTTNQGDVLYDNGTSIVRLTPGTSGQFLQTQGAAANPQWANGGLQLISTTSVSGSANSGDITLSPGKTYLIIVDYRQATQDATVFMRLNSLSTSIYGQRMAMNDFDGSNSESQANNGTLTGFYLSGDTGATTQLDSTGAFYAEIFLHTVKTTSTSFTFDAVVEGWSIYETTQTKLARTEFWGVMNSTDTLTDFEILSSAGTYTGTIKLYEILR